MRETPLVEIVKVDLKSELFACTVDDKAKSQAELMDGKLLLVTNVADLEPQPLQGADLHRARLPGAKIRD